MGSIILWGVILLVWTIELFSLFIEDSDRVGKFILSIFMIVLSVPMLVYHINQYEVKKAFRNIRIGQEYVGAPKDNPFKADTIKVLNCIEKDKHYWVQYQTTDGVIHVSETDEIIDYFK